MFLDFQRTRRSGGKQGRVRPLALRTLHILHCPRHQHKIQTLARPECYALERLLHHMGNLKCKSSEKSNIKLLNKTAATYFSKLHAQMNVSIMRRASSRPYSFQQPLLFEALWYPLRLQSSNVFNRSLDHDSKQPEDDDNHEQIFHESQDRL